MKPAPGVPLEHQPEHVVLCALLCGEARGEQDSEGNLEAVAMDAVLWTAENRRRSLRYRGSLKDIALQPWQYSCFNVNDPNRARLLDLPRTDPLSWERADTIVDLHERRLLIDPTNGATHYCTLSLWGRDDSGKPRPAWHSKQEIEAGRTVERVRYGHHVFAVAR